MRANFLLKFLPILGALTQIVDSHDRFHNRLRSPSRNPNQIFNFQYGLPHQLYPRNYYKNLNHHLKNYNKRFRKRKFPTRPISGECCPCSKSGTLILFYEHRCVFCLLVSVYLIRHGPFGFGPLIFSTLIPAYHIHTEST